MAAAQEPSELQLGAVRLRRGLRAVEVDGQLTRLGGRAHELLWALVDRRERVVSKHELLDLVWPGLVVEENNLQAQISALRKCLGPAAIVTIPGRGYRFTLADGLAMATRAAAAGPQDGPAADHSPTPASVPAPVPAPGPTAPRRHNLPLHDPWLAGRADTLKALLDRLVAPDTGRLLTVVGPGGIGKTSVARALVHQLLDAGPAAGFEDGLWWVDLASTEPLPAVGGAESAAAAAGAAAADGPARLAALLAQATGVALAPAADAVQALCQGLSRQRLLLVLDNCEHVVDAVASLAHRLLLRCAGVRLLCTSQRALGLRGELVWRLDSLSVPPPGADRAEAERHAAYALFERRAREADQRFTIGAAQVGQVVALCRALDGNALALEMAGARAPQLGLEALQARLDDRLRLLRQAGPDTPARQQSLAATLDWSCSLLDAAERDALRALAQFSASFTLDSALVLMGAGQAFGRATGAEGAVVGATDDGVAPGGSALSGSALTGSTLSGAAIGRSALGGSSGAVSSRADDDPAESADEGADEATCDDVTALDILTRLVERSLVQVSAGEALRYRLADTTRLYARQRLGKAADEARLQRRHAQALCAVAVAVQLAAQRLPHATLRARHGEDYPDLDAAWRSAVARRDGASAGLLAAALNTFDHASGLHSLRQARQAQAHALLAHTTAPLARARLLDVATPFGSLALAGMPRLALAQDRVAAWRALGDPVALYRALATLAAEHARHGDLATAQAVAAEAQALEDPAWPPGLRLVGAYMQVELVAYTPQADARRAAARHTLRVARELGDPLQVAYAVLGLADEAAAHGRLDEAISLGGEAVAALAEVDDRVGQAFALTNLAGAHLQAGSAAQDEAARAALARALPAMRRALYGGVAFNHLALLAARDGEPALAAQLLGHADQWYAQAQGALRERSEQRLQELAEALIEQALGAEPAARERAEGARLGEDAADRLAARVLSAGVTRWRVSTRVPRGSS